MTDENQFEEVVERLEAEVKASGADPDSLGIVDKDEYDETQDENETLRNENESLKEEIESVKEIYAEALAEATGLDADFFMDKGVEDLRDLHEEKVDEELVETPDPNSGDVGKEEEEAEEEQKELEEELEVLSEKFSNTDMANYPRTVDIESIDDLEEIIDAYESKGGIWESAAEPYREAYEELTS